MLKGAHTSCSTLSYVPYIPGETGFETSLVPSSLLALAALCVLQVPIEQKREDWEQGYVKALFSLVSLLKH